MDSVFKNGCIVHQVQYTGRRICHFPINLSIPFMFFVFVVLYCCTTCHTNTSRNIQPLTIYLVIDRSGAQMMSQGAMAKCSRPCPVRRLNPLFHDREYRYLRVPVHAEARYFYLLFDIVVVASSCTLPGQSTYVYTTRYQCARRPKGVAFPVLSAVVRSDAVQVCQSSQALGPGPYPAQESRADGLNAYRPGRRRCFG